jgi:HemK-like putative methylase
VVASDLSPGALAVARCNIERLGARDREPGMVALARADGLACFRGPFDLIVSNPPYVGEDERAGLMPDVRDHEPALALFAGSDGMDFIDAMIGEAPERLRPGGALLFEIGYAQGPATLKRLERDPRWRRREIFQDGAGHDRVVLAETGSRLPEQSR